LIVHLNWYRIDFVASDKENKPAIQKEANLENKGAGIFLYFSVDNVDETYKELLSMGLKPSSEPENEQVVEVDEFETTNPALQGEMTFFELLRRFCHSAFSWRTIRLTTKCVSHL
jgi:hypothetical protein